MNITLTPEHEKLVGSQIESGPFRNAEAVVTAALNSLIDGVLRDAPVYPAGSLLRPEYLW